MAALKNVCFLRFFCACKIVLFLGEGGVGVEAAAAEKLWANSLWFCVPDRRIRLLTLRIRILHCFHISICHVFLIFFVFTVLGEVLLNGYFSPLLIIIIYLVALGIYF